jgi:hypothetical protein
MRRKSLCGAKKFRQCFLLILRSSKLGRAGHPAYSLRQQQQQEEDSLSESVSGGLSKEYSPPYEGDKPSFEANIIKVIKTHQVWTVADGGLLGRRASKERRHFWLVSTGIKAMSSRP